MSIVTSLWASVQGDPKFMRRVKGWLTVVWVVMIPVSIVTGWVSSVQYVSALSLWALVSGHWSAWQAARVEVKQQEDSERAEANPVEERVVEKLVEETTVQSAKIRKGSITQDPRPAAASGAAGRAESREQLSMVGAGR